jgi:hypothetical protein
LTSCLSGKNGFLACILSRLSLEIFHFKVLNNTLPFEIYGLVGNETIFLASCSYCTY